MYWKVLSRIGKRSAKDTAIPDLDVHIAMWTTKENIIPMDHDSVKNESIICY
jgi:hypothetical protein